MWVYDIECLFNYSLFCFLNVKSGERKSFEISVFHNQCIDLVKFLKQPNLKLVGFNVLGYDSQLLEFILDKGLVTQQHLYKRSQEIIASDFPDVPEYKLRIKHLDLYKMNHWDNAAKRSSLKWLQFSTDWHNVEDMPIHHDEWVTYDQREEIESYCWNDVESTFELMKLSKEQIKLRIDLTNTFKTNMLNSPEPTISKKILAPLLAKEMGISTWELNKMRTYRHQINLDECILPEVKFETLEFQNVERQFRATTVEGTKGTFKVKQNFKGIELTYGLGGIHGAVPGLHKSDDEWIIKSADVTSFYPMLAINNGFKPAHLPAKFSELYYWFFTERKKYPKSNPLNYVYKIVLNSTYGLSSDKNCFLYDPLMTMQITVNGQLLLSMLMEQLWLQIPDLELLMANTDGFEVKIRREHQELYDNICNEWCEATKLQLEFVDYKQMIVRDVNNYISETIDGYTKCKGFFEYQDFIKKNISILHKNKSAMIVPMAVYNYFIKGIPVEDTILNHKSIFEFCIGVRAKSDSYFEATGVVNGKIVKQKLSKTIRYFISNKGLCIKKYYDKGGEEYLNVHPMKGKTWYQTVANKITDSNINNYGVNYTYYITEAKKAVNLISPQGQTKLL